MQLEPREYYTISRQLNDPSDAGTYYVQAVIRNAKTDTVIDTVNLTFRDNQRYTNDWQVVADVSGLGLYITITTTVYTDSGYSTPSTTYAREQTEHLVLQRVNPNIHGTGGAGGPDISYKKIEDIVKKVVSSIEIPEHKPVKLKPVMDALVAVQKCVEAIEMPEHKQTDLTPVLTQLEAVKQAVEAIEIPKPERLDLTPVLEAITDFRASEPIANARTQFEQLFERIKEFFDGDMEKVQQAVKGLHKKFEGIPYFVYEKPVQTNETEQNEDSNVPEFKSL